MNFIKPIQFQQLQLQWPEKEKEKGFEGD